MKVMSLTALAALVLVFSACNKDLKMESQAEVPAELASVSTNDSFAVKINGQNYTSSDFLGTVAPESDQLVINTTSPDGNAIDLILPKDVKPGTYDLQFLGDYTATYSSKDEVNYVASSGKLTILDGNVGSGKIRGVFSFKAEDEAGSNTANLTDGYFSVKVN
jgi:hypothetical protein